MCPNDYYVSPYLHCPLRRYETVIRDTGVKTAQTTSGNGGVASNRVDDEGAGSRILKRDPGGEGAARRWPRLRLP
jgi:hypothetical protein